MLIGYGLQYIWHYMAIAIGIGLSERSTWDESARGWLNLSFNGDRKVRMGCLL